MRRGVLPNDLELQDDTTPLLESMEIEVGEPEVVSSMSFDIGEDGELTEIDDTLEEFDQPDEFGRNLAEDMEESELSKISYDIKQWVDADIVARSDWYEKLAGGMQLVGIVDDPDTDPTKEDSYKMVRNCNLPLLAEALVQFQARAITELVPPGGPVKTIVLGEKNEEVEQQSIRVKDYMNYDLMIKNQDYYPETDAMLFMLALEGSQFKKVYHDSLSDTNVSRHVRGEDFIAPYGTKSLKSAVRYTHQILISQNDMRKRQKNGEYRDVVLVQPTQGGEYNQQLKDVREKTQGEEMQVALPEDVDHAVLETHVDYDLPGRLGDPDKIGRPYRISMDYESQKIISIYRNWEEDDEKKEKIVSFTHYPFIPADGFYSYGFLHIIGGLSQAATGLLKTILLGASYSAVRGGFKSRDAKIKDNVQMEFGKWIDTDMSSDELRKAFYEPNFKEPGESLFKCLGLLIESAQRFSSTNENMVGDASNTGPVGTTVALIEQGSKVFSGNHKRLHYAQGQEFQMLAKLHAKHLPAEGYPYNVPGASQSIAREDFDDRIDIVPVSDPNIFSSAQRIAIAQSMRQMAAEKPGMYKDKKVELKMLQAMRVPDPEDVLIDRDKVRRRDPITENMCMMNSIPVRAYPDQDHDSHFAVHQIELQRMEGEQNPSMQDLMPAFHAHIAEHTAYAMRNKYAEAMQLELPPVELGKEASMDEELPDIDPEVDNMLSQVAAKAIAKLPPPKPSPQSAEMQEQQAQLEQQGKELEEKGKQIMQAEKLLKTEGEKLNQAKKYIDEKSVELNQKKASFDNDRELAEKDHAMKVQEIKCLEKDNEIKSIKRATTASKTLDQAVGKVTGQLERKSRDDQREDIRKERERLKKRELAEKTRKTKAKAKKK
jgi:hypothetical protein